MEQVIKGFADAKVEAIIVGGAISDLAQHFCNKYNILTLKCQSKYELQRLCRALGATTLVRIVRPLAWRSTSFFVGRTFFWRGWVR